MSDQVAAFPVAGIDAVVAKPISVCDLFGAIAAATEAGPQIGAPSASPILRASSARR